MILLKNFKRELFQNADKYWRDNQKDKVVLDGFELKIGTRLRASVSNKGALKKFYMTVISLEPATIAYWIEGEYAIYLEHVDFAKLLKKRDINKRTAKDSNLHPQNFRYFSAKVLNASAVRTLLWHLPRLQQSDVISTPNSLVLKTAKLIYEFAKYVTADKEPIEEWMLSVAKQAKQYYHTGSKQSELTDAQYDDLIEFLPSIVGAKKLKTIEEPGAAVPSGIKRKTQLDYAMGSLTKIKPDGASTSKFLKETKDSVYVLSDKLDGSSLQLKYVNGALAQVVTRGNGTLGQDVTRHVSSIPNVPKKLPSKYKSGTYNIRAEAILSNSDFEALKKSVKDNDKDFANPRNMVAGIINRNTSDTRILAKLNVVTYSIMSHEKSADKKQQLEMLKEMGFHVVPYKVLKASEVTEDGLSTYIGERKKKGDFELDGAVIEVNSAKIRSSLGNETNSLNPRYARAFKTGDTERAEAHVEEVVWAVSKHGKLKPRIKIKPVKLSGVTINYATAFNAAFVVENKLGPGAKVLLTRSGDVIPHIIEVTVGANKSQLPDKKVFGDYDWNDTEVDLVIVNANEHETVRLKQMADFFKKLGVDYLGRGIVAKFYEAGIDTVDKLINTSIPELMKIDGIQKKSAEKLYTNILDSLKRVDLPTLAAATNFFGENFGTTRMESIYAVYKDKMFDWPGHTIGEVASKIADIKGFSLDTGRQFAKGIKPFKAFLKRNSSRIQVQKKKEVKKSTNALEGISICWTGVRQAQVEDLLTRNGGVVASGVKQGLTYLVAKDPNSGSSKNVKAQQLGVKVVGADKIEKILRDKGAK